MNATDTRTGGWVTADEGPEHQHVLSLYDAHVGDVYRYVHRLCLDRSLAEDVTQDVFVAALNEPATTISVGWLMRSARNRMIDVVRREANYREKVLALRSGVDHHPDDGGAVIEQLRMTEALGRLRTEHRIVLMLHYVDGASVSELAEALGRSYKGVEGLMSRARAALRTELEGER